MSVFPRIDPDHPLAQAARATNAVAEELARAVMATPLWQDFRALLLSCYMDGFAIGWKGHEIAAKEEL